MTTMIVGIVVLVVLVGLLISLALIVRATTDKTKWGINLGRVYCPRCQTRLPMIRRPTSSREALWGGWTCPNCGCNVDKWGREVSARASG